MSGLHTQFFLQRSGFTLDVDLQLPGRGVTALFGPSGCGKTTLLRSIAGLQRVPEGVVRLNGHTWQDAHTWIPTHQRPIGYVFQEVSLFPHLTVLDNLQYGLQRSAAATQRDLDPVVDLLGIGSLLSRKPDALSGGERQRVGIARALAVRPSLLLMDEPLAALDLRRKQEILPYLDRLQQELDIPILYVTHSPDEVARLASHIVVLDQGRLVTSGPLAETLARLDLPIRLGDDLGVVIESKVAAIDARWHLARLDFSDGSLWTRDQGIEPGRAARVRILARDVSITLQKPAHSSIQNILPGYVDDYAPDEHAGQVIVRIRIGSTALLARITDKSRVELELKQNDAVWVQIKSVSLSR